LCGQAGQLEIDVQNAICNTIMVDGSTREQAQAKFEEMVDEGRYNLELY